MFDRQRRRNRLAGAGVPYPDRAIGRSDDTAAILIDCRGCPPPLRRAAWRRARAIPGRTGQ
jgi:hypothetical protein